MAWGDIGSALVGIYSEFLSNLPAYTQGFINIFLIVVMITIYAVLVWKFHRFISKKNIINLNLNKYNKSEHPVFTRLLAAILYLTEYLIILPFLIFLWFAVFVSFLILLSSNLEIQTILFLAITIVGAVRMISYIPGYGEAAAREVAKIVPVTLLAVFILDPDFLDFSRIPEHLSKLPALYESIIIYLSFIVGLELILRIFDVVFISLGITENPKEENDDKE